LKAEDFSAISASRQASFSLCDDMRTENALCRLALAIEERDESGRSGVGVTEGLVDFFDD
jgi:hypothetical protein